MKRLVKVGGEEGSWVDPEQIMYVTYDGHGAVVVRVSDVHAIVVTGHTVEQIVQQIREAAEEVVL